MKYDFLIEYIRGHEVNQRWYGPRTFMERDRMIRRLEKKGYKVNVKATIKNEAIKF